MNATQPPRLLTMRNLGGFFSPIEETFMTEPYLKQALTVEAQVEKLVSRGLIIADAEAAAIKLSCISYYRLSAYSFPFRIRTAQDGVTNQLIAGTTFEQVLALYDFDRALRLLVMDAIERIEIAVRTQLTYHFSLKYGPFGHQEARNFHAKFEHAVWLDNIQSEVTRSSDEFINHYREKYDNFPVLPLWMLTEVMSLGSLSRVYRGLVPDDKRAISNHFGLHHKRLSDWLHTLTYVRNVCAHHSRLWNRELAIRPDQTREPEWSRPITPRNDRVFYVLLMLKHFLNAAGNAADWTAEVNHILTPLAINRQWRAAMGVPDDWINHPIWSR